jgi:DNA-binding NtrC family response regulator
LKPRILVVDDEASIRDTLRMILEYEGYDVLQAATGEDGVRMIEREAPDLVFLDIKMPGMDGLEVLQKVRHLTDSTPIVVISGHVEQGGASSTEAAQAIKLGARDFIEKPPTQDRIRVTVRNALDTSRLRSENRSCKREALPGVGDSLAAGRATPSTAPPVLRSHLGRAA